MTPDLSPQKLALVLGLSFFFGLAFEDFYARRALHRPGGVRTFPLLALAGCGLYLLEPVRALPFAGGLLIVGSWLFAWYRSAAAPVPATPNDVVGLMAPACNLLAYLIGPLVLVTPSWLPIGVTVAAVLLLGAREPLHGLARDIPFDEIATLGTFLVLTGIVLPLLPDHPVSTLMTITPHQVWLAVIAVSTLSYASYLVQRYVSPERGVLLAAVLGGLYSSTATTVVLARRMREAPEAARGLRAGIVLATALMYLRLEVVVAVFSLPLARALAPPLLALFVLGLALAGAAAWAGRAHRTSSGALPSPQNPLELGAALLFAAAFVIIALLTTWVRTRFGHAGLYALAGVVGVTDIDPFVLGIAQGSLPDVGTGVLVVAILIATSSNDLAKGAYAVAFAGGRRGLAPAAALVALAAAGFAIALTLAARLA